MLNEGLIKPPREEPTFAAAAAHLAPACAGGSSAGCVPVLDGSREDAARLVEVIAGVEHEFDPQHQAPCRLRPIKHTRSQLRGNCRKAAATDANEMVAGIHDRMPLSARRLRPLAQ
jgi:hypothetical protein